MSSEFNERYRHSEAWGPAIIGENERTSNILSAGNVLKTNLNALTENKPADDIDIEGVFRAMLLFDQVDRTDPKLYPTITQVFRTIGQAVVIKHAVEQEIVEGRRSRNNTRILAISRVAHLLGYTQDPVQETTYRKIFEDAVAGLEAQKTGDEWPYEAPVPQSPEWENTQRQVLDQWDLIKDSLPQGNDYLDTSARLIQAKEMIQRLALSQLPSLELGEKVRAAWEALLPEVWQGGPNSYRNFMAETLADPNNTITFTKVLFVPSGYGSAYGYTATEAQRIKHVNEVYRIAFNLQGNPVYPYSSNVFTDQVDILGHFIDHNWAYIESQLPNPWNPEPAKSADWAASQGYILQEWNKLSPHNQNVNFRGTSARLSTAIDLIQIEMQREPVSQAHAEKIRAMIEALLPKVWEGPQAADSFLNQYVNPRHSNMVNIGMNMFVFDKAARNQPKIDRINSDLATNFKAIYELVFRPAGGTVPADASAQLNPYMTRLGDIILDSFTAIENRLVQDYWHIEPNTGKSADWIQAQKEMIDKWNSIKSSIFSDPARLTHEDPNSIRVRLESAFGLVHDFISPIDPLDPTKRNRTLRASKSNGEKIRAMIEAIIPDIWTTPNSFDKFWSIVGTNKAGLNTLRGVGMIMFVEDPARRNIGPGEVFSSDEIDRIRRVRRFYGYIFDQTGSGAPADSSKVLKPYYERISRMVTSSYEEVEKRFTRTSP